MDGRKTRRVSWKGDRPIRGFIATDLPREAVGSLRRVAQDLAELDAKGQSGANLLTVRYGETVWTIARFAGLVQNGKVGELTIDGYKFEVHAWRDGGVYGRAVTDMWLEAAWL